jgi:hypothetical protein
LVRISQGSLVVTATTVAVIAVTAPRHSSSPLPRVPDPPRAAGLHPSGPQAARGSVWTLDAPTAPSAPDWGPRGFSAAGDASSMFAHFELSAPDGQAQAPHRRISR